MGAALVAAAAAGCGKQIPRFATDAGFGSTDPPAVALGGRLVTTNNGDDTLTVVDPEALAAPVTMPVGLIPVEPEGPHHISAAPDGSFVYVNLSRPIVSSGTGPHGSHGTGVVPGVVVKLDARDGRPVARVTVDLNPGDNVLTADGGTLYVTHYDLAAWTSGAILQNLRLGDSGLAVVDTATMAVRTRVKLCPAAHGAALAAGGTRLYAACGPDEIAAVDLGVDPPAVRRVVLPGLREGAGCIACPYALAVAPDGVVWVANIGRDSGRDGGGSIELFDPSLPASDLEAGSVSGAFIAGARVPLIGRAMFPAFAPDGQGGDGFRAYVPEQGPAGDWLRVYDGARPAAGPPVEIGALAFNRSDCQNAHMVLIPAGGPLAHVVCEGDHRGPGSVVTVDLPTMSVVRSVVVGVFPDGMALVPPLTP